MYLIQQPMYSYNPSLKTESSSEKSTDVLTVRLNVLIVALKNKIPELNNYLLK